MDKKFTNVYQFRIDLNNIKPPIWRRIQVPDFYTFWELYSAIQDAMGWFGYHLHGFEITNPASGIKDNIGMPDDDYPEMKTLAGWDRFIAKYFNEDNTTALFEYDFGDGWVHKIKLEKILPREEGVEYPICIAGKRACPPEDSGGPFNYPDLLEAIADPTNDMHEELMDWLEEDFDPEEFDKNEVYFDDPAERLKDMLNLYDM